MISDRKRCKRTGRIQKLVLESESFEDERFLEDFNNYLMRKYSGRFQVRREDGQIQTYEQRKRQKNAKPFDPSGDK